MKNKIIYVVALIVLVIGLLVYLDMSKKKNKNEFTFPEAVLVQNSTDYKEADEIIKIVTNKIFLYDSVHVIVSPLSLNLGTDDMQIQAMIKKNPYTEHAYFIKLRPEITMPLDVILCHELWHLKQMEEGRLIDSENLQYNIFEGDTIYFSKVKYDSRSYEIEAFRNEKKILSQLNDLRYKK
jgi:hypothetical protein